MGELIPTIDELKLLLALRRHKHRGTIKLILNTWTLDIEPIGNIERISSTGKNRPLDKKVVTA